MSGARMARNAGFLFSGEVISRAFAVVFILSIANVLGDAALGKYSFAFAIANVVLVMADLGMATLLMREVAKDHRSAKRLLEQMMALKLTLGALALIGLVGFALLYPTDAETRSILILVSLASVFSILIEPLRSIFIGFERDQYQALVVIVERVIITVVGLGILFTTHSLAKTMIAIVLAHAISFSLAAFITRKSFVKFSIRHGWDLNAWKELLRLSWPFWFSLLFIQIYYRVDTLMLTMLTNFSVVGWYNAAYRMVEALVFIPVVIVAAIFPTMSRLHGLHKSHLTSLYQSVFYYMIVVALPIAIGGSILAANIIGFLYDDQFSPAIIALQFLVWSELLVFLNYLIGYLLNAIDKQRLFTYSTGLYLLVNIALNAIAIPLWGHVGAAAVTVITQIIGVSTMYWLCAREGYHMRFRLLAKPIIAAATMGVVLWLLPDWNVVVLVAIGASIYGSILLLTGGIGKKELALLRGALGKV